MGKQVENEMHQEGERSSTPPPAYTQQASAADMDSLRNGDPKETISVPMIMSTEQKRKRDIFRPGKGGIITQSVYVRKMTREHYLQRYAKDAEGNYIGTDKPAPDAGLVFVPSKSSDADILEQVRKVAFGKQHHSDDYGGAWGNPMGAGGGFGVGG